MKRILAIILTVLMLVSVLPISALAATVETAETATATFEINNIESKSAVVFFLILLFPFVYHIADVFCKVNRIDVIHQ